MLSNIRLCSCFLFIFFCLSFSAFAQEEVLAQQNNNPLTVTDVLVDKTARNAVQARDMAIVEARKMAFQILAERSMDPEVFAQYQVPDDQVISTLVKDFEIKDEKISSKRYVANFTVRFNDDAVYFIRSGGGALEVKSQVVWDKKPEEGNDVRVLILPYFTNFYGRKILWEDPNPWRQAWRSFGNIVTSSGVTLVIPTGAIEDIALGSEELIWDDDFSVIEKLREQYDASAVVVALADKQEANMPVEIYSYKDKIFKHEKSINPYVDEDSEQVDFWKVISRIVNDRELFDPDVMRAADATTDFAVNNKTVVLNVTMAFRSFRDWMNVQKQIYSIEPKPKLNISSLNKNSVSFSIKTNSEREFQYIRGTLSDKGLELIPINSAQNIAEEDMDVINRNYILRLN